MIDWSMQLTNGSGVTCGRSRAHVKGGGLGGEGGGGTGGTGIKNDSYIF